MPVAGGPSRRAFAGAFLLVLSLPLLPAARAGDAASPPLYPGPSALRGGAGAAPPAGVAAAAPRREIRFDAASFDPLAEGEPDFSRSVPEAFDFEPLDPLRPRLALVQFAGAPGPAERAALLAAGITPLFYVPDGAYLVRADAPALARASGLPGVRWAGRYRPGYKVPAALHALAGGRVPFRVLPGEGAAVQRLDLLLAPGADAAAVAETLRRAAPGVEVLAVGDGSDIGLVTVGLAHARLALDLPALASLDEVLAVVPRGEVQLHNDDAAWIGQSYNTLARQNYAQSATIWNRGLLGEGEIIAIADTGVDPDVCWMIDTVNGLPVASAVPATGSARGPMPVAPNRRKIIGYNLLGTFQAQATPYDVRSGDPHGTWAAVSAVGDNPDNTTTEADPTRRHHDSGDGMAPLAKLVVEDLGDDAGKLVGLGLPLPTILNQLFEQEREAGARISTNSWGIEGNQYDALAFFTDRMVFDHPDFLPVFSAGNAGPYPGSLASPATAKNVLTVGASEARIAAGLDTENLADFSARGPTIDGRLKPDVVISGRKLVTGTSDRAETGRTCTTFEVNGTSFSAPVAAGFAALAREYYRKGYYPGGTRNAADGFVPSAALVKATMIAGAKNMVGKAGPNWAPCVLDTCELAAGFCNASLEPCLQDSDCWQCSGNASFACTTDRDCDLTRVSDDAPTNDQGYGRILLDDALYFAGDARGLRVFDVPRAEGLATGESWRGEVYVSGTGQDLQFVLTWTDPPALVASPTFLVNDLDLRVTAPDGTVFRGNAFAPRDRSPFTIEASQPGGIPAADVDNVELVRVRSFDADPGVWTVEVIGDSVPGSPWIDGGARQGFALVAVGPLAAGGGMVRIENPRFACGDAIELTVTDVGAAAPLTVRVTTPSGDDELVTLTAVGGGRFAGTLASASGAPLVAGNGRLEVADGETITASYDDASPAHTARASATADCAAPLLAGRPAASGGCDGDAFLDAGEEVELALPLVNPGALDLAGVTARLVSRDGRVYVVAADATYGAIGAGASALPSPPFRVSLRPGAAPRSTAELFLEVRADGWTAPRVLPLTLPLAANETVTSGTWSEDFAAASGLCYDGSASPPANAWYWFDVNQNCATTESTWNLGFCFGTRQALLPSCTGQLLGSANERHHRLVSPRIVTGAPGSTTLLRSIRFKENYHLRLNLDGKPCDRVMVEVFTNADGRTSPSSYYRDRSGDVTDAAVTIDPSTVADWVVPPLPDATTLQLIFHLALHDSEGSAIACGSGTGVEARWRVDDVRVDYDNIETVDDSATCTPACTAPPVPGGVTVTPRADGTLVVGWDPVAGAHHYDVYRRSGAGADAGAGPNDVFVGRVAAPDTALVVAPGDAGPFTYAVEAADASGLCGSGLSADATAAAAGSCAVPPAAPAELAVTDAATGTCRADLEWPAVAAPCGGPVRYLVYRDRDPSFSAGPATLVAEVDAPAYADLALTSGWNAQGEPVGDAWTYEVRAQDLASGLVGPGRRASVRPGGPRVSGTWIDDAGDARPAKMTSLTLADDTGAGAAWTRSPAAVHRSGGWSYWPDVPFGQGEYPALSCLSLVSPAIELGAGAPQLRFWLNYQIEHQWDGLVVEVAGADGAFAPVAPAGGYPGTFANTVAPPCAGSGGGAGPWINGCDYPPTQGCVTGPADGGVSGWREFVFDLAPWAGGSVAFRLNLSTDCGTSGGAVVDDLSVTGARLATACSSGACWPPPAFAGLIAAVDLDAGAPSGVELTWGDVESWGGGGPGVFEIWRDGTRVAELGPGARAYVDAGAPNVEHEYVVLARSGGGCGLRSATRARIHARDCGPLDAPALAQARLDVTRSPAAVVLRAEPLAGAARYRFRWSHAPGTVAASPDALDSGAPEARHPVLGDGLDYFYLVEDGAPPGCP